MKHAMISNITMYEKDPARFEERAYGETEKKKILEYMRSFEPCAVAGRVEDCKTGERTKEENIGFSDGLFLWCSQDIYHLERYDAAVCEDFAKMIIGNN